MLVLTRKVGERIRIGDEVTEPPHFVGVMAALVPQLVVLHRRKVERRGHYGQRKELRVVIGEKPRGREHQIRLDQHVRREIEVGQRDDYMALQALAGEMDIDCAALTN